MKVRNSRKIYIPFYIMIVILVAIMVYLRLQGNQLNSLALIVAGLFIFFVIKSTEIHRLSNSYEITDTCLRHVKGIFHRQTTQLQFPAMSDVNVNQNILQLIFGYGDVNVHLFSRESMAIVKNIDNPYKFMNLLEDRIAGKNK